MLSIPQKGRTGNAVMDANLRAAHTRERLLQLVQALSFGASVVFRIGFLVVDAVNLKSFLWLSRMFLIQSIDEAAVGLCVAYSASCDRWRSVDQERRREITQEFCP